MIRNLAILTTGALIGATLAILVEFGRLSSLTDRQLMKRAPLQAASVDPYAVPHGPDPRTLQWDGDAMAGLAA